MDNEPIPVRLAAGVLNQTALDIAGNCRRIVDAMAAARECGSQVLCLPELCISGYGSEDQFFSPGFRADALDATLAVVPESRSLVTCVGLPLEFDSQVYNVVAVMADGDLLGFVAKQYLARHGLHYEPRWFCPWIPGRVTEFSVGGRTCPLGDLLFDLGGVKLGFEICEDAWVAGRPLDRLIQRGAKLILNPSASHFAFGKNEVRKKLVLEGASQNQAVYVYANMLGNEAGRAIYDGDAYIAADGKLLVSGRRFSFRDRELTVLDCPVYRSPSRPGNSSWEQGLVPTGIDLCNFATSPKSVADATVDLDAGRPSDDFNNPNWENSPRIKCEEFSRAVALGLFDYMRKSRSSGVVISLSGGADSAAVACLSRLMLELAVGQMGIDAVLAKLDYIDGIGPSDAENWRADWLPQLIFTAYQATRNSSKVTRLAAVEVAEGCSSEHVELDIDAIVAGYQDLVGRALGRELNWEQDDIALQNIQARSRSPGIWMFANIRNSLLLSTSNRSEAAVGYSTMDGDTSGGLAPIAGIDKAFLRDWLRWMETDGPMGVGPFAFLASVNSQQPTAELRPQSSHQTDEDDLMPYPVLDFIERAAVRDKKMPREIVDLLVKKFEEVDRTQAVFWIQRFFRLWCRNQWKRERYAPSFHLDDENLDPKTWCRFPILSGGFEEELRNLR